MKCKISGCENDMVVAGPPNAREEGICWDHAIAIADRLSEASPVEILHATGILPIRDTRPATRHDMKLNRDIKKISGEILARLEALQ